jgi:two-component system, LuxR family, response regulator FixJ
VSARSIHIVVDRTVEGRSRERLFAAAHWHCVTYVSGDSFLEVAPRIQSGCILIDSQQGPTLLAGLRALSIFLPIIVIGEAGNVQAAVAAMKQGAFDVIERPADDDMVLSAIERALVYHEGRGEVLEAKRGLATLSMRERQVLNGLAAGQGSKAIAHQIGISVRTVEVHRARMLRRLGVQKIAAAIRIAVIGEFAGLGCEHTGRASNKSHASTGTRVITFPC